MSRILYWDIDDHSLVETGERRGMINWVEYVFVQPAELTLRYAMEETYDLIAIHHNDYFTGGVAERIRRMSRQKDTLLVGVTGAIGPDRLETFKRGLGEHTIWDDFIVRSVDELRGTLLQLVGILESVESQRNA